MTEPSTTSETSIVTDTTSKSKSKSKSKSNYWKYVGGLVVVVVIGVVIYQYLKNMDNSPLTSTNSTNSTNSTVSTKMGTKKTTRKTVTKDASNYDSSVKNVRYVRIEKSIKNELRTSDIYFSIAEVIVKDGTLANVALNKKASQISTAPSDAFANGDKACREAGCAVDGNTDGEWFSYTTEKESVPYIDGLSTRYNDAAQNTITMNGSTEKETKKYASNSITHTYLKATSDPTEWEELLNGDKIWWEVDLGREYGDLSSIEVYNRTDEFSFGAQKNLSGASLCLLDSKRNLVKKFSLDGEKDMYEIKL